MTLTPQQIIERLEGIEQDVWHRQLKGEQAAENYHHAKRDYELAFAEAYVSIDGGPMDKKVRATALLADKECYFKLKENEAAYEGWRAAMRTLELRATIGQSLLKAQRELGG